MSTFTEWNGPAAGRGPSTKDVLALIDAYNSLNTTLTKHLASTDTDDVHNFKTAIESAIAEAEAALEAAIALKADSDTVSSLSETVSSNSDSITAEADRAQAVEKTLTEAIAVENRRALKKELALDEAISELESLVNETKETFSQALSRISFDDDVTTTVTGVLAATEYFIGMVKVKYLLDFVGWKTFNAQYAGTGTSDGSTKTNGVYILGMISEEWDPDKGFSNEFKQKGARAYIKYVNDRPFDLVVDMVSTGTVYGKITCLASFKKEWTVDDTEDAWEDMTLHLLTNTDSSGAAHVYLGISARGLSGQSTTFHVAGENFIAGGKVNGITSRIGFTRVSPGFNCYRANFDDLRITELHDTHGDPILTVTFYTDENFSAEKILTIADPSFTKIYFSQRPSVVFSEDNEDGTSTSIIAPVLTSYDLDALDAGASIRGIIVFWPQWEEALVNGVAVRRAKNYPAGWIACDGSIVQIADYPQLIEIMGLPDNATSAKLPRVDYAIMRIYTLFENVELADGSKATEALTNAELQEAIREVRSDIAEEATVRAEADAALEAADENLQAQINQLDEDKAEVWEGSKDEFDADKDSIEDGTIVLSPDDLNH